MSQHRKCVPGAPRVIWIDPLNVTIKLSFLGIFRIPIFQGNNGFFPRNAISIDCTWFNCNSALLLRKFGVSDSIKIKYCYINTFKPYSSFKLHKSRELNPAVFCKFWLFTTIWSITYQKFWGDVWASAWCAEAVLRFYFLDFLLIYVDM